VLAFSSFSPKLKHTDQKQVETAYEVMFRTNLQRIKNREREREKERERERRKKDTKQLYMFLPQTGSSHVPLALPRRVHYKVISDYNCSSTQARDFLCS